MKGDAIALTASRSRASDFVMLAKPRLNLLVVASALAGYVMAGGDLSNAVVVVCTVLGTALVAGGASAFNQVIERVPDSLMRRTRLRPVPDGRLQPFESLVFATALVDLVPPNSIVTPLVSVGYCRSGWVTVCFLWSRRW